MIRKYEIEIEIDDGVLPDMGGSDVDFTLCHALGQALKDVGFQRGRLLSKTGRTRYTFDDEGHYDKVTP